MDRRFAYIGAIPQDLDALTPQVNTMKALGWLSEGILGWNTLVDGLSCIPTSPTSLAVQITAGQIFQQEPVDSYAFGSISSDIAHNIIKQGILADTTTLTLTPPSTSGYAQNYLVQAQIIESDVNATVLPYFNPASLTNSSAVAWSGPNNSGVAQPITRTCSVTISLKPGTAATAGTQTTPAPDVGYVGMYAITVAQGQTQITSGNIVTVDNAPFIWLKLPQVPLWVQGGTYAWASDTSVTANNIQITLNPLPAAISAGFGIRCKVANANTGAATITINRNTLSALGPYTVTRATGSALLSGDIAAGQVVDLVFDGTSFRDITGTTTSVAVGSLTAQSGEGIFVDGTAHVNLNYPGLSAQTPAGPDLFSFYSQADTHHRVLTYAQLLAAFNPGGGIVNIQVITSSGSYVKTAGVKRALVFVTGGGAAGGAHVCCAGGGGSGSTAVGLIDVSALSSVSCTIGAGGTCPQASPGGTAIGGNGGTTSFGAYVSAGGGTGCQGVDKGGAGGMATLGAMLIKGGDGLTSYSGNNGYGSANGGPSFWGGGGAGADAATNTGNGYQGQAYGSGGGGADSGMSGGGRTGGAGQQGVIFIMEF